jgi:hypothetical protein
VHDGLIQERVIGNRDLKYTIPRAEFDPIVLDQLGKGKSDVDIVRWINRMAVYQSRPKKQGLYAHTALLRMERHTRVGVLIEHH